MNRFLLLGLLPSVLGAQVSYSPQPIAFGAVKLGASSAVLSSTLTNTGTDTLKFVGGSSMTGSPAFAYVTDNCSARPPGGTCVLQYRFTPTQVGPITGANVVQTNHGPFPLNFTGMGLDTMTAPPVSTSDTTLPWTLASRVHARDSVCAHATVTYAGACGTTVAGGVKGTIIGGPGKDAGWTFWQVRFDNSVTGWARQALLALDTLGVPQPPPSVVKVTSVAVAPVTVTLAVAEFTVQLYGFRSFSDGRGGATVATLLWTSSDTNIVKVTQGVLIPVGPGVATITASDSSRTVSATSVVTVLPQKQVMMFGQPIWTGATVMPVSDSTGRITARVLLVVRAP